MKCTSTFPISLLMLVNTAGLLAGATSPVTPLVSYRSQSENAAREIAGWTNFINKADKDVFYGTFAATTEYTRSSDNDEIIHALFGCYYPQSCNVLKITGSQAVSDHGPKDLLAEWFYLPPDYEGSICFQPVVQNFIMDLNFYWGMDLLAKGTYLRIHTPLVWTSWNLGASFSTKTKGSTGTTYLSSAEKFFCSKGIETSGSIIAKPLSCARFCGGSCEGSKTLLADIQADYGWNFLLDEDYHLGLFIRGVAPTGNAPKGEWLFEPIVGNGHHWELGGGLTGSTIFWRDEEEAKSLGFYVDANITHLFNAGQNRVFDLKNKPLSRYMYAQTGNTISPIANLTSCRMNVNIAVQADILAMFCYTSENWTYDLGYNFWARSCEKFECTSCGSCTNNASACTSCEGSCGKCIIKNGNDAHWAIDAESTINTQASGSPHILTDNDIDYNGARTKGMSNKVFAHMAYGWLEHSFAPYLGFGGEVEFGRNDDCCGCESSCSTNCGSNCSNSCSCCANVALSQWGIWLKGGMSF